MTIYFTAIMLACTFYFVRLTLTNRSLMKRIEELESKDNKDNKESSQLIEQHDVMWKMMGAGTSPKDFYQKLEMYWSGKHKEAVDKEDGLAEFYSGTILCDIVNHRITLESEMEDEDRPSLR